MMDSEETVIETFRQTGFNVSAMTYQLQRAIELIKSR